MCDKFEKPLWVELLPADRPDSDAFHEELHHEFSEHRASPCEVQGGCLSICLQEAFLAPCHDVTIQNPPNALINTQSVVLQLRQPGGTFLRFSPKNCTLYASSILGSASNAMVRVSHVMLNASCVHTRILWPTSNLEMDVIGESLMPPLVANAFDKCEQLDQPKWLRFLPADANDLWREDFLEPAPKASNAFAAGMVHKHSARKLRQVKCANIE